MKLIRAILSFVCILALVYILVNTVSQVSKDIDNAYTFWRLASWRF